jgi:hypothetical protein
MIKQRNFIVMLLLTLITCGIYGIVFWYSYSEDMNKVCNGDGKETKNYIIVILLSIVTCGIYSYIWYYGVGNRLQENAPRYGLRFSENGSTVLLWMLLGYLLCGLGTFYGLYILVKNMNAIADRYNQQFYGGQNQQFQQY